MAQVASRVLRKNRFKLAYTKQRVIPTPGYTRGKQNTVVPAPEKTIKHEPSVLSREVNKNDIEDIKEKKSEDMEALYGQLGNFFDNDASMIDAELNTYIAESSDEEAESDVEVTGSSMAEPDDYDVEMAKTEEEGLLQVLGEDEQTSSLAIPDPASAEESGGQTKRKWEPAISHGLPTVDLPGHVDHDQKRRKLEIGTNTSQDPPPELRKKKRGEGRREVVAQELFCRGASRAAVFQAAIAVGALKAPQGESVDGLGLDPIDLEPLGAQPSSSEQKQSSVNEDFRVAIGEALYPRVSHEDLQTANAAANLLGNSNVSELESADRKVLEEACGSSVEGASDKTPSTTRFSSRCTINRSFMLMYGGKIKRYEKPIKPSKEFQSFFATRRLRKNLLLQDKESWTEEDTSFVLSGKKMAEPGARFGAEFVAKCLLDV